MVLPVGSSGDRRSGYGSAGRRKDEPGGDEPFQFSFADEDEELPWLLAEEDDDEADIAAGRIVLFVLSGLVFSGLVIALLWLVFTYKDPAKLADGSIIEAPAGPYKIKPQNTGGRQVEGTGAASFEVGQGKRVEARVAASAPPPVLPPEGEESATNDDAPAEVAPRSDPAPLVGVAVQLASYPTREAAIADWRLLVTRYEVLQGHNHRIVEGVADAGVIYRLQVVTQNTAAAQALCRALRSSGGDCQVKD